MRPIIKFAFTLLLLCGVFPPTPAADKVDDYITAQMQKRHIPGLSLLVIQNGQAIKAKGYGLVNIELNYVGQ